MKQERHWMDRLTEGLDLPGEVSNQPLVELAGDRRVLIEHHRGIVVYQQEHICVKLSYGTVSVFGCSLHIARMTKEQLIIHGQIDSIKLNRRKMG